MASFDKLFVGQVLYDYHKYKMGNTTMKRLGEWTVSVKEINLTARKALCSWNGNTPRWYYERQLRSFKINKKERINGELK